ncbi:hypothetical protein B0H10DRAFT_2236095 [Mycena sp. CBHHK59/15]|nr:hypothetical protein B0H10DRAFT_2236095 [Mycena sp. CBHHK59/15]
MTFSPPAPAGIDGDGTDPKSALLRNDSFVVTAAVRVERDVAHSHHSDSVTLEERTPSSYQARLATVAVVGLVVAVGNSEHTNCTFFAGQYCLSYISLTQF